jgi:hypothetical protein
MKLYVIKFEDTIVVYSSHPLCPDLGYPILTLKKGEELENFIDILIEGENLFEAEADFEKQKRMVEIGEE